MSLIFQAVFFVRWSQGQVQLYCIGTLLTMCTLFSPIEPRQHRADIHFYSLIKTASAKKNDRKRETMRAQEYTVALGLFMKE